MIIYTPVCCSKRVKPKIRYFEKCLDRCFTSSKKYYLKYLILCPTEETNWNYMRESKLKNFELWKNHNFDVVKNNNWILLVTVTCIWIFVVDIFWDPRLIKVMLWVWVSSWRPTLESTECVSYIPVGLWWNWNDWICILLMLKWVCIGNEGMALIVKMGHSINHTVALSSEWNMDFRNTIARGECLTKPTLPYFSRTVSNLSGLKTPGVWL